jgi:hypothetical protein
MYMCTQALVAGSAAGGANGKPKEQRPLAASDRGRRLSGPQVSKGVTAVVPPTPARALAARSHARVCILHICTVCPLTCGPVWSAARARGPGRGRLKYLAYLSWMAQISPAASQTDDTSSASHVERTVSQCNVPAPSAETAAVQVQVAPGADLATGVRAHACVLKLRDSA